MKIVRENINFERGDPRDTLGLSKIELDQFPSTKSFLEHTAYKLSSTGAIDIKLSNVIDNNFGNSSNLSWIMPLTRTKNDTFHETTNCMYILLMEESDGLSLQGAEAKRSPGPSIPFKEEDATTIEWETDPNNISNVIGWLGWEADITSIPEIIRAMDQIVKPNLGNWSYL